MYLSFLRLVLLCFFSNSLLACDICGSSLSGSQIGVLPQFRSSLLTFKTNYQHFNINQVGKKSNQFFLLNSLSARVYLHKRWQLLFFLPILQAQQVTNQTDKLQIFGLSDLTFSGNYLLFDNNRDSNSGKFKQLIMLGAGLKLPTGTYQKLQKNSSLNPYFQLGSGSWDAPFSLLYVARYEKWGLNNELNYRINTTNSNLYKFGDQLFFTQKLFYWHKKRKFSTVPQLGYLFENNQTDKHRNQVVANTANKNLLLLLSVDFYYKKLSFGFSAQIHLKNYAATNEVQRKIGFQFSTNYIF